VQPPPTPPWWSDRRIDRPLLPQRSPSWTADVRHTWLGWCRYPSWCLRQFEVPDGCAVAPSHAGHQHGHGCRGGRYWRSRLVVRSDARDDPDEFHDVGGDLPWWRSLAAARVAAALASAVILGELAAGIVLGATGSGACRRTTRRSRSWCHWVRADQEHKIPPGGVPGGLFGAGYWGSSGRTLAAWAPLGPCSMSKSTAWPSSSER
jgi:hypothetical protein